MEDLVFMTRGRNLTSLRVKDYDDCKDMNTVIWMMKSLDYPFIVNEWYEMDNPTIKKYIKIMNLAAYKNFGFKDSKSFNINESYNMLLKQETREDSYNQVVAIEKKDDKHLKGYMFDSLIYRFMHYQQKAFDLEVKEYRYKHSLASELDARNYVQERHNRDLIRFIEILNEAIGEHD